MAQKRQAVTFSPSISHGISTQQRSYSGPRCTGMVILIIAGLLSVASFSYISYKDGTLRNLIPEEEFDWRRRESGSASVSFRLSRIEQMLTSMAEKMNRLQQAAEEERERGERASRELQDARNLSLHKGSTTSQDSAQRGREQQHTGSSLSASSTASGLSDKGTAVAAADAVALSRQLQSCRLEQFGGTVKPNHHVYGAWTMCSDRLPAGSTVYSFGIGEDVSFDVDALMRGWKVFAFDPTVPPARVNTLLEIYFAKRGITEPAQRNASAANFTFQQIGLSPTDGVTTFFKSSNPKIVSMTSASLDSLHSTNYHDVGFSAPVLRLATVMSAHHHTWLDVLKMDVEATEFGLCNTEDFKRIPATQVLVEFHDRMVKDGRKKREECVRVLEAQGFTNVHVSRSKEEWAFARLAPGVKAELYFGDTP